MKQERMIAKKWGVMVHFLEGLQNNPDSPTNENVGKTTWDELVNGVDVEKVASQLHKMGAGWFLITLMQGQQYMIAPNATYDRITGYKPGEACSTRDLVLDLYEALKKYDIDLYLYYTGDGPHKDEQGGRAMGLYDGDTEDKKSCYYENWSAVLKEYAERYKGKVVGWWIDGCYPTQGYNDETLKWYDNVFRSADENYIIAYNDGWAIGGVLEGPAEWRYDAKKDITQKAEVALRRCSVLDDYLAGEALDFNIYPTGKEDCQWHILSPLSGNGEWNCGWARDGVKYTKEYFTYYLDKIWEMGGVATVEMGLCRTGRFFDSQREFMKAVIDGLKNK